MDHDELLGALRARAQDPARRLECETSAFGAEVASMGLGQMFSTLRELGGDLRRLLQDPLAPPPDLVAKAESFGERMHEPADRALPPPASAGEVAAAVAAIGTAFPPLLRSIYTDVANGGFGPGYGLLGVGPRGWTDDQGRDLVAMAASMREASDDLPEDAWHWPPTLLPIAHLGDAVYACIDATRPDAPVLEYDPSDLDWDEDGYPLDEQDAFTEVSPTLAGWLAAWLESPSAAEQHEALFDPASDAVREQLKYGWSMMSREERLELGITDWHYEHGELPDAWR